jgi:hypothetical protein
MQKEFPSEQPDRLSPCATSLFFPAFFVLSVFSPPFGCQESMQKLFFKNSLLNPLKVPQKMHLFPQLPTLENWPKIVYLI